MGRPSPGRALASGAGGPRRKADAARRGRGEVAAATGAVTAPNANAAGTEAALGLSRETRQAVLDLHMAPALERYLVEIVLASRDPARYDAPPLWSFPAGYQPKGNGAPPPAIVTGQKTSVQPPRSQA